MNLFDFSSALPDYSGLNPSSGLKKPTVKAPIIGAFGGGMSPPTVNASPLTSPDKILPKNQDSGLFGVPSASASSSGDFIQSFIDDKSVDKKKRMEIFKMVSDGVPLNEIENNISSFRSSGVEKSKKEESPVFKDQHKDEGSLFQALMSLPRGAKGLAESTASSVGQFGQGVANLGSKAYQAATTGSSEGAFQFENPYTSLTQGSSEQEPTSIGNDLSKIGAGGTTTAFNVLRLIPALAINTAKELPGGQYVIQGLSKGLEMGAEELASLTGMSKDTAQNTITTIMNSLGLSSKAGSTSSTASKVSQAFNNAPTKTMGAIKATASVLNETVKTTKDVVVSPVTVSIAAKNGVIEGVRYAKGKVNDMRGRAEVAPVAKGPSGSTLGTLSGVSKESIDTLRQNPNITKKYKNSEDALNEVRSQISELQAKPENNPERVKMLEEEAQNMVEARKTSIENDYATEKANIISRIDERFQKAKDELAGDGEGYGVIRTSGATVNTPRAKIIDVLSKFGVEVKIQKNGGFRLVKTAKAGDLSPTDLAKLTEEMNLRLSGKKMGAEEFLQARKVLSKIADYDIKKRNDLDVLAGKIRAVLDESGKEQLPGLRELDATYAAKVEKLQKFKERFIDKDGKVKENIPAILDSLKKENKGLTLAEITKEFPELNLEESVSNLTKLDDLKSSLIKPTKSTESFLLDRLEQNGVTGVRAKISEAQALSEKLLNLEKLHKANLEGRSSISTSILDNPEFLKNASELLNKEGIKDFDKTLRIAKALEEQRSIIGRYPVAKSILYGAGLGVGATSAGVILPATVIAALLTSPRFAGYVARTMGKKDIVVEKTIEKIQKNLPFTKEDYQIIRAMGELAQDKKDEKKPSIKKPK